MKVVKDPVYGWAALDDRGREVARSHDRALLDDYLAERDTPEEGSELADLL